MKAAFIEEFGGRDVIEVGERPKPEAGAGDVLVRVRFAGVGPWDHKMRTGYFGEQEFPLTLGLEGSGTVEAVGAGVDDFSEGDAVVFSNSPGYAEYAVASAENVVRKPDGLTFEQAAALPLSGGTAYQGIFDRIKLKKGETVLIPGAAGGVGNHAVQMAHALGAKVIATASQRNHEFLKSLGADVTIDYSEGDWVAAVREVAPDGVDAVLDCVGAETFHRSFEAVKDGGRVVSIVAFGEEHEKRGISHDVFMATITGREISWLVERADAGEIAVEIEDIIPLDEAVEAHRRSEEGHVRGKLLIEVSGN